jgi:hypothetical protein
MYRKSLRFNKSPAIRPEWGQATPIKARRRMVDYFHACLLHEIEAQ